MTPLHALAILAAGVAAGTINTLVGSGTLITFPVLLAFGYAPVTANVTNAVGLVPGSAAGAIGYRRELRGQRRRAVPLLVASTVGAVVGAVLLLSLPASAFKDIVPVFIAVALVLIVFQPQLTRALQGQRRAAHETAGPAAAAGTAVTGVYGGYFGAAQGILLLSLLGLTIDDDLQRLNALKNVLTAVVNGMAAVVFAFSGRVDWTAAAIIAAASLVGGQLGAAGARRLRPDALRLVIVAGGVAALVKLLL